MRKMIHTKRSFGEEGCENYMTTEMNTYICRISRTTKVYKNPDDMKPSTYSIQDRSMFLSYMQVTNGSNTMFQVLQYPRTKYLQNGMQSF